MILHLGFEPASITTERRNEFPWVSFLRLCLMFMSQWCRCYECPCVCGRNRLHLCLGLELWNMNPWIFFVKRLCIIMWSANCHLGGNGNDLRMDLMRRGLMNFHFGWDGSFSFFFLLPFLPFFPPFFTFACLFTRNWQPAQKAHIATVQHSTEDVRYVRWMHEICFYEKKTRHCVLDASYVWYELVGSWNSFHYLFMELFEEHWLGK